MAVETLLQEALEELRELCAQVRELENEAQGLHAQVWDLKQEVQGLREENRALLGHSKEQPRPDRNFGCIQMDASYRLCLSFWRHVLSPGDTVVWSTEVVGGRYYLIAQKWQPSDEPCLQSVVDNKMRSTVPKRVREQAPSTVFQILDSDDRKCRLLAM